MKFPASQVLWLFRNKLYNDFHFSLNIQKHEINNILRYQNDKFIKLIKHAKENVPYYSEFLQNVNNIQDLSTIPFLTKVIIKDRILDLKATNLSDKDFIKNSTSGSTGESMHFFSDRNNNYSEACAIRGDMLSGWDYGEKFVIIWGALRDFKTPQTLKQRLNKKLIKRYEILSSFYLSEDKIEKYINFINEFKPTLIIGYPTGLFLMADYILKYNKEIVNIKAVISAGETLYEFQREAIEKAFQQKVFNRYACRDVVHIASECKAHDGLHISADHVILEVLNEKGEPCKPGEVGEIVLTDLDNFAFPFIRYKIGDLGILRDPDYQCPCGIRLPMLEKVEGRTMDIVVGPNGNRVTGTFWTLFFRHNFHGIEKFQVVQETLNNIKIDFEISESYDPNDEERIKKEMKKLLGDNITIEIEIVNEIDKTATGKHRWIISKVSPYV